MNIYKAGKNLVSFFYTLIKAVQVYDFKNDVVQNAAQKFVDHINYLFGTMSTIELVRFRDYVFFYKQRLRFEIDGYASLQFIDDRMKKLKIKSLTFLPGFKRNEAIELASIFKEEQDVFLKKFSEGTFEHTLIEFVTEEDEIPEFLKDGQRTKQSYFRALKTTRDMMQNLWQNQPVDVRSSKRIIYNLIDSLSHDEVGLLALTTIKNFDEYTFNHSLNVGILALLLGQRIGLSKKSLAQLGTAGILHDIGKVAIPKALIYNADGLTAEEWEIIKRHSNYGVEEILKLRGLDEIAMASLIVSYQHHWNYDGTGYPRREVDEKPVLYAKILRICDSYDAMTTARVYQPVPYVPHLALKYIWARKNRFFDPILVKVFIQLLGLYPVGSCLELSSGDVGLVIRQNPGYLDLPILKIVVDSSNKRVDGQIIDLSVKRDITIVKPVYPQKYGINPASYFV